MIELTLLLPRTSMEFPKHMKKLLIDKFGSLSQTSLHFRLSADYFANAIRTGRVSISVLDKVANNLGVRITIRSVYSTNGRLVKIPRNFQTEHVARILGNILGDGCIDKNFVIRYTNTSEELLEDFNYSMSKVFGYGCLNTPLKKTSNYMKNKIYTELRCSNICGKILINQFGRFAYGKSEGANEKFIPPVVFEWPEKLRWAFIAAIIDDEGSIGYRRISINQVAPKLTADIENLLKSLGIRTITYKKPHQKYRTGFLNRIEVFGKYDGLRVINMIKPFIKNKFKIRKLHELENYFISVKSKRRKGDLEREILSHLRIRDFSIKDFSKELNLSEEPLRRKLVELYNKKLINRIQEGRKYKFQISQSA